MLERQKRQQKPVKAKFRPSADRLREIAKKGSEAMKNVPPEDIGKISETSDYHLDEHG